jgi:hypothetical protein
MNSNRGVIIDRWVNEDGKHEDLRVPDRVVDDDRRELLSDTDRPGEPPPGRGPDDK